MKRNNPKYVLKSNCSYRIIPTHFTLCINIIHKDKFYKLRLSEKKEEREQMTDRILTLALLLVLLGQECGAQDANCHYKSYKQGYHRPCSYYDFDSRNYPMISGGNSTTLGAGRFVAYIVFGGSTICCPPCAIAAIVICCCLCIQGCKRRRKKYLNNKQYDCGT